MGLLPQVAAMLGEAAVAAITVDRTVRNAKLAFVESMLRGATHEDGWRIAATAVSALFADTSSGSRLP